MQPGARLRDWGSGRRAVGGVVRRRPLRGWGGCGRGHLIPGPGTGGAQPRAPALLDLSSRPSSHDAPGKVETMLSGSCSWRQGPPARSASITEPLTPIWTHIHTSFTLTHSPTYKHTLTPAPTYTHPRTHPHTDPYPLNHAQRPTPTHTPKHTDPYPLTHPHTQTHTHSHPLIHPRTQTHTHAHTHTDSHPLTHAQRPRPTHTHSHIHAHRPTPTPTHPHRPTCTLTHTHINPHRAALRGPRPQPSPAAIFWKRTGGFISGKAHQSPTPG